MGFGEIFMAGSVAIALAGGGYGFLQNQKADLAEANLKATKHELSIKKLQLNSCAVRLDNILQDKESDDEIDNIPDLREFTVPDHWLLVAPT